MWLLRFRPRLCKERSERELRIVCSVTVCTRHGSELCCLRENKLIVFTVAHLSSWHDHSNVTIVCSYDCNLITYYHVAIFSVQVVDGVT